MFTKFNDFISKVNEYNSQDLFLSNYDTALKYAYDNIDDVAEAIDNYNEDPDNEQLEYVRVNYIELIDLYVDKYNELKEQSEVIIYRMVILLNIKNLDLTDIGSHWSFEESGVGAYGLSDSKLRKNGKEFILTAKVNPKDIDWVYGFSSFIWYGEEFTKI